MFGTNHKTKKEANNAMVVIEKTKERDFQHVLDDKIPSDSFEQDYKGKWLHILGLDLNNEYWTLEPISPEEGSMPTDLFMAKHCADEVNEVYGNGMPTSEKIKLGILVGLCVGILIVIFLIAASSGSVPK